MELFFVVIISLMSKVVSKIIPSGFKKKLLYKYKLKNLQNKKDNHCSLPSSQQQYKVDLLSLNFFDRRGDALILGGGERYVYDLAKLLKMKGHAPRIVQSSEIPFQKQYNQIDVIGLPSAPNSFKMFAMSYNRQHIWKTDFIITSPCDISAYLNKTRKVLGINHGIHWDQDTNRLVTNYIQNYEIFKALSIVDRCICVDTNFINWVRTYDYGLSLKMDYIPNYYDQRIFQPKKKSFNGHNIIITFPRRLSKERGFYLMVSVVCKLLEKYNNIIMHFVGQAMSHDEKQLLENLLMRYPEKIKHYQYSMDEMYKAYEKSQIVVIPTVHSEGTSLSAIEAMAMNNALIVTNVGGLPNVIIDSFNGKIVSPIEDDLQNALEELICNRSLRIKLASNAINVVNSFNKELWNGRWNKVIDDFVKLL